MVIVVAIVGGGLALFASSLDDNSHGGSSADAPAALTVNGNVAPVGVDPDHRAFAWHVVDARQSAEQTAYRILVSTKADPTPGSSGVVWDDAVRSGHQAFVAYSGAETGVGHAVLVDRADDHHRPRREHERERRREGQRVLERRSRS